MRNPLKKKKKKQKKKVRRHRNDWIASLEKNKEKKEGEDEMKVVRKKI